MTLKEFAAKLNRKYPMILSEEEIQTARENGFVIVYGASDDLIEIRGAIEDEGDCYDGGYFLIDEHGILPDFEYLDHDNEKKMENYFRRKNKPLKFIRAIWCGGEYTWKYETDISDIKTFEIIENDNKYCLGFVFHISSLKEDLKAHNINSD
ncbi:MAG: hypothetical protein ACTSQY_00870 [Candidatus Odinarchaeia archaeon]